MLAEPTIPLTTLNILVLDDNPHMREVLHSTLSGFGVCEIHAREGVRDALVDLIDWAPDIALVDYQLNGETGLDFVRALRNARCNELATLPVIMVTSHDSPDLVTDFTNAGADEIVIKPLKADVLYDRIAAVVNDRRAFIRTSTYFGPDRRRVSRADAQSPLCAEMV